MNKKLEKEKLFQWINMISFVVDDALLYLDTHPEDKEAIEYFNHFCELRNQALKEYALCYEPLTIDTALSDNEWRWVKAPWPWEGGVC